MSVKYTREQFIELAVQSGYGKKSSATEYADTYNKAEYTTDDFIALYHKSSKCMNWPAKRCKGLIEAHGINGRTTAFSNGIMGNSGSGQDWR